MKFKASEYSDRVMNLNKLEDRSLESRIKIIEKQKSTSLHMLAKDIKKLELEFENKQRTLRSVIEAKEALSKKRNQHHQTDLLVDQANKYILTNLNNDAFLFGDSRDPAANKSEMYSESTHGDTQKASESPVLAHRVRKHFSANARLTGSSRQCIEESTSRYDNNELKVRKEKKTTKNQSAKFMHTPPASPTDAYRSGGLYSPLAFVTSEHLRKKKLGIKIMKGGSADQANGKEDNANERQYIMDDFMGDALSMSTISAASHSSFLSTQHSLFWGSLSYLIKIYSSSYISFFFLFNYSLLLLMFLLTTFTFCFRVFGSATSSCFMRKHLYGLCIYIFIGSIMKRTTLTIGVDDYDDGDEKQTEYGATLL